MGPESRGTELVAALPHGLALASSASQADLLFLPLRKYITWRDPSKVLALPLHQPEFEANRQLRGVDVASLRMAQNLQMPKKGEKLSERPANANP